MEFLDAYGVLGVSPGVSQERLKEAHRALVRQHHPDLVSPEERAAADRLVREINVAYGLVCAPGDRSRYDRVRRLHLARCGVNRAREADEAELAAQWEMLSRAAGRRAGEWLRRDGGPSYRAGRTLGRWLG